MKIVKTKDPLDTKIELEPFEKEIFRKLIYFTNFEDEIFGISYSITFKNKEYSMTELKEYIDAAYNFEVSNDQLDLAINDLNSGHIGDCTSVPCSCIKCYYESMLKIDTRPAGKHVCSSIEQILRPKDLSHLKSWHEDIKNNHPEIWEEWENNKKEAQRIINEHASY